MDEKKVYYLDLQTLLTLLHNKTGTLTTKVKIGNQVVLGTIAIVRGQVASCVLETQKGKVYGQEALERLKVIQEWQVRFEDVTSPTQISPAIPPVSSANNWQFVEPIQAAPMPPALPPSNIGSMANNKASIVPKLIRPFNSTVLTGYNSQQLAILRLVYGLVDGQRTMAQIQNEVQIPRDIMQSALDLLRHLGMIVY